MMAIKCSILEVECQKKSDMTKLGLAVIGDSEWRPPYSARWHLVTTMTAVVAPAETHNMNKSDNRNDNSNDNRNDNRNDNSN